MFFRSPRSPSIIPTPQHTLRHTALRAIHLSMASLLFGILRPLLRLTYIPESSYWFVSVYWFTDPVSVSIITLTAFLTSTIGARSFLRDTPLLPRAWFPLQSFQRTVAAPSPPAPFGTGFLEADLPGVPRPFGVHSACCSHHSRTCLIQVKLPAQVFQTSPSFPPLQAFAALFQAAYAPGVSSLQSLPPHPGFPRSPARPAIASCSRPESACVSAAPPFRMLSTGLATDRPSSRVFSSGESVPRTQVIHP